MQFYKMNSPDNVERINDISERFGHLPSMSISNHRVQIDILEGQFACQFLGHEYHFCNPEEQNVMTWKVGPSLKIREIESRQYWKLKRSTSRRQARSKSFFAGTALILTRLENAGREERGQIGSVLRPAEDGEGPHSRGEPRVQHVFVWGSFH